MIIPQKQVQKIADLIGRTIQKDVNIMDETGCIIASTDGSRVGMTHSGAVKLLENQLEKLVIERDCKEVRRGINLPLCIENQVIGAVGITGAVEEVQMLGLVIKKMTEILILDWYKSSQRQAVEEMKRGFLVELLFGDDLKKTEFESEMMQIDLKIPRIISVIQIDVEEKREERAQTILEEIIAKIKKEIETNRQQLSVCMGVKIISIHSSENEEQVAAVIEAMKKKAEKKYPCKMYCGVGRATMGKTGLKDSYREANMACYMVKEGREGQVKIYRETDLSMLLIHIPLKKREAFVSEIFKNCDAQQRQEILQCLKHYIDNNGSISKISDELYIHKNTLQYRLGKIKMLTGYDPRILAEAIPLAVALYLDELQNNCS